ncbi:MAG: ATP-binding protein [Mongoliibacter sp.]|uniref:ATP-binding protein n=1 Tax=Mongoliibacter sp. TaxID=2022438 RepID=UPI0012F0712C|nr:ATP-binding protein [Mongoliibacter sp.]TVP53969.1 MAG: ATP-binding protein [Mongoliibacter sp.]
MEIKRKILSIIQKQLYKGKVIILYGARRTGKTTLVKKLMEDNQASASYFNCELQENQELLSNTNSVLLKDFVGKKKLIILDEAQYIPNIGLILKVLVDTFPGTQFLATGSSSFELSNQIAEPLTGRSRQFLLLPFSLEEVYQNQPLIQIKSSIPSYLRFGMYPQVYMADGEDKIEELMDISTNYLYKDILQLDAIKKPDILQKLLKGIALQLGSESSLNELAQLAGTNVHTVNRYLDLLEKAFVIFRLTAFSKNLRKEINKSQKIYFYDLGIRNAIIRNFSPLDVRTDIGGLWENFCISERLKYNQNHRRFVNTYFWRTYDQQEIDYIEEVDGKLYCFEFKYNPKSKSKFPKIFRETYTESEFKVISPENFYELADLGQ